jgi:hypothetical protein
MAVNQFQRGDQAQARVTIGDITPDTHDTLARCAPRTTGLMIRTVCEVTATQLDR